MEKIIERYQLNSIHDMCGQTSPFSFTAAFPSNHIKKALINLVAKPLTFIETYLASEGFIAYQDRQDTHGMKLALNDHIFFEFVPFNNDNFDADGNLVENPEALDDTPGGRRERLCYSLSTTAGAWRYLIGDTVRFVDKERCEIIITGRTKALPKPGGRTPEC